MQVLQGAGDYTDPGDEPNHYVEHFRSADLSVGTYSIPARGIDDQEPHGEDEIYVVTAGRATIETASGSAEVGPGSVVYVASSEEHRFVSIDGDLSLLVLFAPPYESRSLPSGEAEGSPAVIPAARSGD
jgi:mannose-6-phosphate isomerase-like protein (cupin superfamily)